MRHSDTGSDALEIIQEGMESVRPEGLMRRAVRFDREKKLLAFGEHVFSLVKRRLFVVGAGKASGRMAEAFERMVQPEMITAGIVTCKDGEADVSAIEVLKAGHPVPDARGVEAVRRMLDLRDRYGFRKTDLVVALISGGGSALMPLPAEGISLDEKQATTRLLLSCGADIHEMNAIRKHLSGVKGGWLARKLEPAGIFTLIISDVIGDDVDAIASGPTVSDPTTFQEAIEIVRRRGLADKVPEAVLARLEKGAMGGYPETPKDLPPDRHMIIGTNRLALEAMAAAAGRLGYKPLIVTDRLSGDTDAAAIDVSAKVATGAFGKRCNAIILGGETTPKLPEDHGRGGRNQQFVAVSMLEMGRREKSGSWLVASVGTDGSDYLPDVAGAIADQRTGELAINAGFDPEREIERFNTSPMLDAAGALVRTGPTGTNVGDVILYLLRPQAESR